MKRILIAGLLLLVLPGIVPAQELPAGTDVLIKIDGLYDNANAPVNMFSGARERWFAIWYYSDVQKIWLSVWCVTRHTEHFNVLRELRRDVKDFSAEMIQVRGKLALVTKFDPNHVMQIPVVLVRSIKRISK